jgi:glycosyltransferase involved in cell wall biosynthesis
MNSILEVCASPFTYFNFVHALSLSLIQDSINVIVAFTPEGELQHHVGSQSLSFYPIRVARSLRPLALITSLKSLRKLLKNSGATVIHIHTPIVSYLVRFLLLFQPGSKFKVIYTVHGFYFHPNSPFPVRILHYLIEYLLSFRADLMLFVSKSDYILARSYFFGSPSRMLYTGNGVDTSFFMPPSESQRLLARDKYGYTHDDFVIGFTGRLVSEKGLAYLLKALPLLLSFSCRFRILIVGSALSSDYDGMLHSLIKQSQSEYPNIVQTPGMLSSKTDVLSSYHAMDAFCLPSLREGCPTSLLEAMSCALPCVATDIRGCNELIVSGSNGLLVPPSDPSSLASSLTYLLSSPTDANRLRTEARRLIACTYDLPSVLATQREAIRRLIAEA